MKHRMLIKRRDGVRQHYHIGRRMHKFNQPRNSVIGQMHKRMSEQPYDFQDFNQEKLVHSDWKGFFRYALENSGDIFREFSKYKDEWFAQTYIEEKIRSIENQLQRRESDEGSWQYLWENNKEKWEEIRSLWEEQPTKNDNQILAKRLTLAILDLPNTNDVQGVKSILKSIRARY